MINEGSGEYVHLGNLVRVLLLTNNIKFDVDGDSGQINSRHVCTLCLIQRFLSTCNNGYSYRIDLFKNRIPQNGTF